MDSYLGCKCVNAYSVCQWINYFSVSLLIFIQSINVWNLLLLLGDFLNVWRYQIWNIQTCRNFHSRNWKICLIECIVDGFTIGLMEILLMVLVLYAIKWDEFCYASPLWCRINQLTYWPAVLRATTVLWIPLYVTVIASSFIQYHFPSWIQNMF